VINDRLNQIARVMGRRFVPREAQNDYLQPTYYDRKQAIAAAVAALIVAIVVLIAILMA
jgi:hypothetical protein